ncbi:sugar ABC transporter permease [Candidatus Aerophobetes bacterium]|nr:sugar ABC transporter permease [Candidatus Aerophobetes bacterium]
MENYRIKRLTPYLLIIIPILFLLLFIVYSFGYAIKLSITHYRTGEFVGLHNFLRSLRDSAFATSLRVTVIYVLCVITVQFSLGLVLALVIHRIIKKEWAKALLYIIFIIPMVVPPVVAGVIARLMYTPSYGIVNNILLHLGLIKKQILWLSQANSALFSVMSVDIWQWTPFVFLVFFAGLESIPVDIVEAAKIDGASASQMFKYIELPYLKTLIIMVIMFRFTDTFRVFDHIMVLTQGGPGYATEVLSIYLYRVAFKFWNLNYAAALSFFVLIVASVVFMILNKFLWTEIT